MPNIIELSQPISDRTDPQLSFNSRAGGMSVNGIEQVISPLTAVWKWRIVLPINSVGRARSIRTVKSQLQGRFNYLRTRVCDRYRIGRRDIGAWSGSDPSPFGDGAYFSDGSGFSLAQPLAEIVSDVPRYGSSIRVPAAAFAGAMSAGTFFSINDYLYQVDDWEPDDTGEFIDISFSPPLREAVSAGDEADFDAKALWVLDSDDEGKLALRLGRFGEVELNLTEAFGRSA